MDRKNTFGIIGGLIGAAAIAALFIPYERKQSEDGFQLSAVAYEINCRNDGENRNFHVNLFAVFRKQFVFFKELFEEVKTKVQNRKEADASEDFDSVEDLDLGDLIDESSEG